MCRITTVSIFVTICFIGVTYGTECTSGPGYRFPITCPGLLDSTKKYCCEIGGSFRCCDEKEFSHQEEYTANEPAEPLALRHKRYITTYTATTLSAGAIIGICILALSLVGLIICCCLCCACCPCYYCCHPHNSNTSNVTIVQSMPGNPPAGNNYGQMQCGAMPQNPPPAYA